MKTKTSFIVPGLSEYEGRVWRLLHTGGPKNITSIARALQLHRPTIYRLISDLTNKGLVKKNQVGKRCVYQAAPQDALDQWHKEWVTVFAESQASNPMTSGDEVMLLRGPQIRQIWQLIIESVPIEGVFYRYDAYRPNVNASSYLPPDFYDRLERKKIDRIVITNQALKKAFGKNRLACTSGVLPSAIDAFEQGVSQFIFEDYVAFIDFLEQKAFVIKNRPLAQYHRHLFRYVYQSLKQK